MKIRGDAGKWAVTSGGLGKMLVSMTTGWIDGIWVGERVKTERSTQIRVYVILCEM